MKPIRLARPAAVFLDIDGTLLLSCGGALDAMSAASLETFGKPFDFDRIDRHGVLDPDIVRQGMELAGIEPTDGESERFEQAYFRRLAGESHRFRRLEGVTEMVESLLAVDRLVPGLVTGNFREAARIKLEAVGLPFDRFVANGFGGDAPTRPGLVERAIEAAHARAGEAITPADCIVVGDTPRDIECAQAHGCPCLAVATGGFSRDQLTDAGADVVVDNLNDLAPLWAMLPTS